MEDWKERLIKEQEELKERLVKLITFMNSEKYYSFDDNTKAVFAKQRAGMELYLSALNIRVFGDTANYSTATDFIPLLFMSMFNNSFAPAKSAETEKLEKMLKEMPVREYSSNDVKSLK